MGQVRARCGGDRQALAIDHGHPNHDDQRLPKACRTTSNDDGADLPGSLPINRRECDLGD
jgi:hypothetical protein